MPDPNSNTQLPEGMTAPGGILGGDIKTQFIFRPDQTDMEHALAAVKADQEMICGYKLFALDVRSMELADEQGRYVEAFVLFSPANEVS